MSVASLVAVYCWRPGALRSASVALAAWFPYLFLGCLMALSEPLAIGGNHTRCGNGIMGLYLFGLLAVPVLFGASTVFAVGLERFRVRGPGLMAALVVTAMSVGLLGAGLRRLPNPEPDGYVASLPVVATLGAGVDRFAGPGFSVEPGETGCSLSTNGSRGSEREVFQSCQGVQILHGKDDLWFVQEPGRSVIGIRAERLGTATGVDVAAGDVAGLSRAPSVWMGLAAAGTAVAIFAVVLGAMARRRGRQWRLARPGVHDGGGWLSFEDGAAPVHVADAACLPNGAVLVLEGARAAGHYREHGGLLGDVRVAAGSLREVEHAGDTRMRGFAAFAILLLAVTSAPLLAAATRGLLG